MIVTIVVLGGILFLTSCNMARSVKQEVDDLNMIADAITGDVKSKIHLATSLDTKIMLEAFSNLLVAMFRTHVASSLGRGRC